MAITMLNRTKDRYHCRDTQTTFAFSEPGIAVAIDAANRMRRVKATIVADPGSAGERIERDR